MELWPARTFVSAWIDGASRCTGVGFGHALRDPQDCELDTSVLLMRVPFVIPVHLYDGLDVLVQHCSRCIAAPFWVTWEGYDFDRGMTVVPSPTCSGYWVILI